MSRGSQCPRCDGPTETIGGGVIAIMCGPGGGVLTGEPTTRCADPFCRTAAQREADEAAIERAIAAGVIRR